MVDIQDRFAKNMVQVYGEAGRAWLERLPSLIAELAQHDALTIAAPFPNLSYNYVAPAVRADGKEVVVKIGYPGREFLTEIDALSLYNGRGMVQLLDAGREQGFMVLERVKPGMPVLDLGDDEKATSIAAHVMQEFWRPVPPGYSFPTVADWAAGLKKLRPLFGGTTGPLPARYVEEAEALFAELLPTQAEPVLLHGDLHHWNILSAEREPWLAIDPKGVIGEPAYEIGAWLRNPLLHLLKESDLKRMLERRIAQFSEELGFDRTRLRDWAFAQAVLSAWWSIEDHGSDWHTGMITLIEVLSTIKE